MTLGSSRYEFDYSPFRIRQYLNDSLAAIINHKDTLYFENSSPYDVEKTFDKGERLKAVEDLISDKRECLSSYLRNSGLSNRTIFRYFAIDRYRGEVGEAETMETDDYRSSFSLGFYLPARHLFGLPERPDSFKLGTTEKGDPYRLHALDVFPHKTYSRQPLYSSMPYLTAHGDSIDVSVLWMTASETWVDLYNDTRNGSYANFVTESGKLEFFLFSSQEGPSKVQKTLVKITGFPTLPPIFSLGYHYSKWE